MPTHVSILLLAARSAKVSSSMTPTTPMARAIATSSHTTAHHLRSCLPAEPAIRPLLRDEIRACRRAATAVPPGAAYRAPAAPQAPAARRPRAHDAMPRRRGGYLGLARLDTG